MCDVFYVFLFLFSFIFLFFHSFFSFYFFFFGILLFLCICSFFQIIKEEKRFFFLQFKNIFSLYIISYFF